MRRIEIQPKAVYWSESGELCCIATEESYFVLKFNPEAVTAAADNKDKVNREIHNILVLEGESLTVDLFASFFYWIFRSNEGLSLLLTT